MIVNYSEDFSHLQKNKTEENEINGQGGRSKKPLKTEIKTKENNNNTIKTTTTQQQQQQQQHNSNKNEDIS